MLKGTVTASVWATRRVDSIPRGAFLEVLTDDGARLIAFDVLGSGIDERVLIATGSVASGWFGDSHPPIDALIIGSLDPEHEAGPPTAPAAKSTKGRRT
jgi:ethanolamine utilization protein EutN